MARSRRTAFSASVVMILTVFLVSACAGGAGTTSQGAPPVLQPGAAPTAVENTAPSSEIPAGPTLGAAESAGEPSPVMPTESPAGETEPPSVPGDAQVELPPTVAVPSDTVSQLPNPGGSAWVPVAAGLTRPVDLADLGDGTGRMLVLEQVGVIRIIQDGNLLPEPFLDLRDRVGGTGNERGLLGIALHPRFFENRFFYLNYTDRQGDTVVSRFTAPEGAANQADAGTEKQLLWVDQPYGNHNGGVLKFGPDGYLYIGLGDGGAAGDPHNYGQSMDTLLGKVLRIDVDNGEPYAVPADNPFASGGGKPEIWAYGLRNPWRFSFDRLTGDFYIADVGQGKWEEINFQPAGSAGGENYGWKLREGAHSFEGSPPGGAALIDPVFEYSHGDGCSVTGGFVYRGEALAEFRGVYLFADYCSGKMWGLLRSADGSWQARELFQTGWNITSFGQDAAGELYITEQSTGGVYRLARN